MDHAFQRLIDSINFVTDIRLECIKAVPDIKMIRERTVRLDVNLSYLFDEFYDSSNVTVCNGVAVKRRNILVTALQEIRTRFESLNGHERDLLLAQAGQTLPPNHQNDAGTVFLAALELMCDGPKRIAE